MVPVTYLVLNYCKDRDGNALGYGPRIIRESTKLSTFLTSFVQLGDLST
jgi:hypothetical protein